MNLFEQIALGWQSVFRTLSRAGRAGPWVPFAILGVCEAAVLAALTWFAHPALSWFMAPLLYRAGGADLLHYPNVFRAMPDLYGRADFVLGATVGAVVVGAATRIFANQLRGRPARVPAALSSAGRRAVTLVLVGLPFNLLVFALTFGLEWLLAHRGSGGVVHRAADLIVLGGSVVLQSLFFYVACDVMIAGRGALETLRHVPHAAGRGFWAALTIGILLALPLLPLHFLAARNELLVQRGAPELVGWLMVAQIVIGLVLWIALAGSATLVYLTVVDRDAGLPSP